MIHNNDAHILHEDESIMQIFNGNGNLLLYSESFNLNQELNETLPELKVDLESEISPISPTGPPNRENYPGVYNFNLEINGAHIQKKKYLYSHKLHRIYVDMDTNFSVKFNWNTNSLPQSMYVRATVVFSDDTQAEKRVERCYQHSHEASNAQNMPEAEKMNVLRSARAPGSPGVFYCGDPALVNSWYSVVVLFPMPSSHAYKFVCKNSCSSGINRRAISIIFTLEDLTGLVYGRDSVGVRVCSCPCRDLKRDEKDVGVGSTGKRRLAPVPAATPPSPTKKIRLDLVQHENLLVELPAINVVGVLTAITGLNVMLNMMRQSRTQRLASDKTVEDLDKAISNITTLIEQLERSRTSQA